MSLGGHLKEFRNRFFVSLLAIGVGTIGGWYLYDPVYATLKAPIDRIAAEHGIQASLNFSDVMGAFDLHLQMSVFLGIILASPIWLFNLWAFITPALKKRERKYTVIFILSSMPLFFSGTWLAWVSYPTFINVLVGMSPPGSTNIMNAADYMLFALRILILFGLAFVSPVALVLLDMTTIITAKNIFNSWRVAVVLISLIAAVCTPTADPLSMLILMIPLAALYFAAGGVAAILDKRREKRQTALVTE